MDDTSQHLPATFRQTFEAGREAIAQAWASNDGLGLLQVVSAQQRELRTIAPRLVDDCLRHAGLLEGQLAALVAQRIEEGFLDRQAVDTLLDQGPRALRQYQFVGELAQSLDYFSQRFLSAAEERTLRKTIRTQGLAVEQALNGLLGHVINEVLFDSEERSAMRRTAQELQHLGKLLEKPRDSGVLKSDYTVRRRQFIRQVGWLCLRIYGHVTTDIMVRLLDLKHVHYLTTGGSAEADDDPQGDAINRELSTLRTRVRQRAATEQWETAAVVKAFFAKAQWKGWLPHAHSRHDAGLPSAVDHSGRSD